MLERSEHSQSVVTKPALKSTAIHILSMGKKTEKVSCRSRFWEGMVTGAGVLEDT